MATRDQINNLLFSQVLIPQVLNTTALSTVIDTKGFNANGVIFNVGDSGDTLSGTVYYELELQDSDDDVTYAACADADVRSDQATDTVTGATATGTVYVGNLPAEDSLTVQAQYTGNKRYIKANVRLTGTHTNGIPVGVAAVQSFPDTAPVA
jgi:hypothetical protein